MTEATGSAPRDTGAGPEPLLEVRDLRTWFATANGPVHAVDGVSFSLRRGELLGVVGESGSGKSVLCRSIMGLLPPATVIRSGSVVLDGEEIIDLPHERRTEVWGRKMAMVFQDASTSLNPTMKVGSQLTEGMRHHLGLSKADAKARAITLMREVGIADAAHRFTLFPHEFSGGMRQRLCIAIALSCEPALIFADEPTTALDVTVEAQVLDLLEAEQRQRNMGMIMVTHNLGILAGRADRVAVMYGGTLLELAPVRELFAQPRSPYTQALLDSLPRVTNASHTRLKTIGGRPPQLLDPPPGCRFADRCSRVEEQCREQAPPLTSQSPDHAFSCWNPVPVEISASNRSTDKGSD